MSSSIVTSFLGALQASLSVLLTILYGVLASKFGLLSEASAKDVANVCVKLFLPALLITQVGSELHLDTGLRYVPILIWAFIYNAVSIAIGYTLTKLFKLPGWVVPSVTFNNTTSLPLLLVQSLASTGVLESLVIPGGEDTVEKAIDRAKSYFLVNSMVSNSLTFAIGPHFMGSGKGDKRDDEIEEVARGRLEDGSDEEQDESSQLIPKTRSQPKQTFSVCFPTPLLKIGHFLSQVINAPLVSAIIGAMLGLTPPLHRLFFNSPENGGYFTAWLTASVRNIGNLFASLQIIVVGVKLVQGLRTSSQSSSSSLWSKIPWTPFLLISLVRFVLWPAISIPVIHSLSGKARLLSNDPILWFTLMLMPTGPPALKMAALGDVSGSSEEEKGAIAVALTMSYAISPLICFAVVGSLKASEAAMGS